MLATTIAKSSLPRAILENLSPATLGSAFAKYQNILVRTWSESIEHDRRQLSQRFPVKKLRAGRGRGGCTAINWFA